MADKSSRLREAYRFISKGQMNRAIGLLEEYVHENPDGNIYNTIGDIYFKAGDRSRAVENFHKAAGFFSREGFTTKAHALYKKILNIEPHDTSALIITGELNEEKGLLVEAVKYYLAALDVIAKSGDKTSLREITQRIFSLAPSNISLQERITELLLKEGSTEEAARGFLRIGMLLEESGNREKAMGYIERALEVYPPLGEAYPMLLNMRLKEGEHEKARGLIERWKRVYPDDIRIDLGLAELLVDSGAIGEAKETLLRILTAESEGAIYIRANELLAGIYLCEGKGELALQSLTAAVDEYVKRNEKDEAIGLLNRFRETFPFECTVRLVELYRSVGSEDDLYGELLRLGEIKSGQDDPKGAVRAYMEALRINPDSEVLTGRINELEGLIALAGGTVYEEKSVDERLTDADIFIRYGLLDEAIGVLEQLKVEEPFNIEVHKRLKDIFVARAEKEQAITECLILSRLYEKEGMLENMRLVIKEAFEIDSDDPRLLELSQRPEGMAWTGIFDQESAVPELDFFGKEEGRNGRKDAVTSGEPISGQMQEAGPGLEHDVLEIFEEFKKSVSGELDEKDYETHYNLGIAYKEMGLLDDAIKELVVARGDAVKRVQVNNLLGMCYMQKGDYTHALESFEEASGGMAPGDDAYWDVRYDLAGAYEKAGDIKKALQVYGDIYSWNSEFRDVERRLNVLRQSRDTEGGRRTSKT